jgi:hypothetical protein
LNGVGIEKVFKTQSFNRWLVCGLMVYSYSRRLLFEYIHCLPNGSDDVVHVETDGIYFSSKHVAEFERNLATRGVDYTYATKLGEDLGNLKFEKHSIPERPAYFLGKKFYLYNAWNPNSKTVEATCKIKGIPQSTIDECGNKIRIVDEKLYEDIYAGMTIPKSFSTMKRSLFGTKTQISSHIMTRNVKPNCAYREYGNQSETAM